MTLGKGHLMASFGIGPCPRPRSSGSRSSALGVAALECCIAATLTGSVAVDEATFNRPWARTRVGADHATLVSLTYQVRAKACPDRAMAHQRPEPDDVARPQVVCLATGSAPHAGPEA